MLFTLSPSFKTHSSAFFFIFFKISFNVFLKVLSLFLYAVFISISFAPPQSAHFPYIPLRGRGSKGWGDFSHYPHIPLRGRGYKGWGDLIIFLTFPSVGGDIRGGAKLPSLSLHSPPWEGIKGWGELLIFLIFPSVGGDKRGGAAA
jgi:hypothetical protein